MANEVTVAPLGLPAGYFDGGHNAITMNSAKLEDSVSNAKDWLSLNMSTGVIAGFADTVLQSVGVLDKDEMATMLEQLDKPLGQYYAKHTDGLRTVGDIGGSMIPVLGATKLVRARSVLGTRAAALFGDDAARMMFSTGKSIPELTVAYKERAQLLARYGTKTFAGPTADAELLALAKKAKMTTFTDILKEGVAADVAVYATMNESDTLFPDEWSGVTQVAFAGGINLGFAGVGALATRFAMKRALINDVGPIVESVANQSKLPITDALSNPDTRGSAITLRASLQATAEAEKAHAGSNAILASNVDRAINVYGAELKDEIAKLATDSPIEDVTTRFAADAAEVNTVYHALHEDQGLLFGARSMERFDPANPQAILQLQEARLKKLDEVLADAKVDAPTKRSAAIERNKLKATTAFVVENDGGISNLRSRKPLFQDQANWINEVKRDTKSDDGVLWKAATGAKGKHQLVGFTSTGHPLVANSEREFEVAGEAAFKTGSSNIGDSKFDGLDLMARSALYASGQKALKHADIDNLGAVVVNETTHHTRIDWLLELLDNPATAGKVRNKLKLPAGKTVDDLHLMALDSKMAEYGRIRDRIDKSAVANLVQPAASKTTMDDIARMLNLPAGDSGGMHPLIQLMEDKRVPGKVVKLSDFIKNEEQLKEAMVRLTAPNELGQELGAVKLRGNMLKFGEDRRPVVIMHYQRPEGYITRQMLVERVAAEHTKLQTGLSNATTSGAELVGLVHATLMETPEVLAKAKNVSRLTEGSQMASDRFVQPTFALRENQVVQAVDAMADITDKRGREWIKAQMQPHSPVFSKLISKESRGDLENLAIARNSMGQGWDLKAGAVQATNANGFHLVLDPKSKFNQKRYRELYETDMPTVGDVFMPTPLTRGAPTPTPLLISPLALQGLDSLRQLGKTALAQTNYLRMVQGKSLIPVKEWHLPPKNLADKHTVFLVDEAGQLNQIVSSHSEQAANQLAKAEIEAAAKDRKLNLHQMSFSDVREYYNMMDEAAFGRMQNFASTELQTGKATGKSFGQTVETGPEMLIDMVNATTHHLDEIIKRTRGLMFAGEVRHAHSLRQMADVSSDVAAARHSIWDQYINRVYGKPTLNENTVIGKLYYGMEGGYNHMLTAAYDRYAAATLRNTTKPSAEERDAFAALQRVMGQQTPFNDMTDYIEHTYRVSMPPSARKHMAAMNEVVSFATLRLLQIGPAVVNYLGLGSTMPAVVKAMKRRPDQTVEQWKASISAWGSPVTDDVALWSPKRAMQSGIDFMFAGDSKEWMKVKADATARGYLHQEVAESLDIFTAPTQGFLANMLREKARFLSQIVDKSELASRSITFATGYNMGRKNLQLSHESAMLFAHKFANSNIGDYRPNNRPQIFQGAPGMGLGLFTTFMWNFLQRVGANMEARQYGALLTQAGMQFALFGGQSLPGFNQFVEAFNSSKNEHENLIDGMNSRFGHDFTEWFLNGTVSTLPKMFGAETGVAIYSRADINLPFSRGGDVLANVPSFTFTKNAIGALSTSIKQISATGGFNVHQQSEILQQYGVINGLTNPLEVYHGYSIDRAGAVINADTHDAMSIAARLMGFKTARETDVRTEFARSRAAEQANNDKMMLLRDRLRAAARDGMKGQELRDFVNESVRDYVAAGGEVDGFRRFFTSQVMAGTVEKGQTELAEALRDSNRQGEAVRLLYLQDRNSTD